MAVPSVDEILENIRNGNRRNTDTRPDDNVGKVDNRPGNDTDETVRRLDDGTPRTNGYNESLHTGTDATNDRFSDELPRQAGALRLGDSSINERDNGLDDTTRQYEQYDTYVQRPLNLPPSKHGAFSSAKEIGKKFRDSWKGEGKAKEDSGKARGKTKTLSDAEARGLKPKLVIVLLWQSEHADEFITATTKGHVHDFTIWANLDNEDAEFLADMLLRRAKKDAMTAEFVRDIVELEDYIKLGTIFLPRFYMTYMIYRQRGFSIWI